MLPLGALRLLLLLLLFVNALPRAYGAGAAETYTEVYTGWCKGESHVGNFKTQAACQVACSKKAGCVAVTFGLDYGNCRACTTLQQGNTDSDWTTWARGQSCAPGNSTATFRAKDCAACPAGKSSDPRQAFGGKQYGPCAVCVGGTFADQPRQAQCKACPPGRTSASTEGTRCLACPAGKIFSANGCVEPDQAYTEIYTGECKGSRYEGGGMTLAACQAACSERTGCVAITFDKIYGNCHACTTLEQRNTNSDYSTWARGQNCSAGSGTGTFLAKDCKQCPTGKSNLNPPPLLCCADHAARANGSLGFNGKSFGPCTIADWVLPALGLGVIGACVLASRQPAVRDDPYTTQKALAAITLVAWASVFWVDPPEDGSDAVLVVMLVVCLLNLLSACKLEMDNCNCFEHTFVVLGTIRAALGVLVVSKDAGGDMPTFVAIAFIVTIVLDVWAIVLAGQRTKCPCCTGAQDAGGCRRWLASAEPATVQASVVGAADVPMQPMSAPPRRDQASGVLQAVLIENPLQVPLHAAGLPSPPSAEAVAARARWEQAHGDPSPEP